MSTPMPRVPLLERWEVGFSEERMREYGRLCYEAGRADDPPLAAPSATGAPDDHSYNHVPLKIVGRGTVAEVRALYFAPQAAAPAMEGNKQPQQSDPQPVVWQQTSADGEPLWDYDNFLSTPEHFDYSRPLYAIPVQAAPARADDVRDAERYRWLRQQHWNEAPLAVVVNPKLAVKLGHDVPNLERLDEAIDVAIEEAARRAPEGKT